MTLGADDWKRLETLWDAAANLSPDQREEFFRQHEVDGALRAELESLLDRANAAEAFFGRLQNVVAESQPTEPPTPASAARMIGSTVRHYRIEAVLGEGGMGVVYRASDLRLRRTVALKLLRGAQSDDPRARNRLIAEARAAGALDNPSICTIYEVGETDEGVPFIAMGYYPGETLEQLLRRGPLPIPVAIDYAAQIARGLGAAHQRNIIHRDVKPGNVVVTDNSVVKLLDFGIARTLDVTLSHDGVTPGTIAYMSPEQVMSAEVNKRSDLWALGVVLYEMCTGTRPFVGEHVGEILYSIVHNAPTPAATLRPDLPANVAAIIGRMLAKDPTARYQNAETLIADLRVASGQAAPPLPKSHLARHAVRYAAALLAMGAVVAFWPRAREAAPSEQRIAAQDLYEQGHRDVLFRTEGGRREALGFFRQAIAVDPTYAAAHAGLAHLLVLISDNAGDMRRTQLQEAEVAARTSIRLDSLLADAHASLGHVLLFDYQFAEAEAEFKRAVALDPKTPYVREFLVWLYVFMNRPREALEAAERAAAENPDSPTAIAEEARALLVNGRCGDAMPLLKRLTYLKPPPARVGAIAAQCHALQAQWADAIDAVRSVAETSPLQGYPWLGFMLARGGDTIRGRQIRDTLLAQWRQGNVGAYGLALAYAGLRDYNEAFEWLDKSIDDRSLRYNIMEPAFEELRRDPRFDRARQRLGIPK